MRFLERIVGIIGLLLCLYILTIPWIILIILLGWNRTKFIEKWYDYFAKLIQK